MPFFAIRGASTPGQGDPLTKWIHNTILTVGKGIPLPRIFALIYVPGLATIERCVSSLPAFRQGPRTSTGNPGCALPAGSIRAISGGRTIICPFSSYPLFRCGRGLLSWHAGGAARSPARQANPVLACRPPARIAALRWKRHSVSAPRAGSRFGS